MSRRRPFASSERDEYVLRTLHTDGRVLIHQLAEGLSISEMTVRRDLDRLANQGQLRRIRGGAVAVGPEPFAQRFARQPAAKEIIADKLIGLVGDGGAIALDASTTIQRLAYRLGNFTNLTVLTNGPETFDVLQTHLGVTAMLTGGQYDKRTGSLVGPIATSSTTHLALRTIFISATGLDEDHHVTEQTVEDAQIKEALVAAASTVILAVDHSKLSQHGAVKGVALATVDQLVTDLDPSDARLDPYRKYCLIL